MSVADTAASPEIASLPLIYRGKVRDLYAVDDRHLLMVASDRLSAFDVILPTALLCVARLCEGRSAASAAAPASTFNR